MNIDERLEALTQTVELIAHAQTKADEKIDKLTALHAETAGFINQLARIAESHEHRIEQLGEELRVAAEESRAADRRLGARIDELGVRIAALVSGFGEFIRQRPSPQQ
jgi:hypothetical protein